MKNFCFRSLKYDCYFLIFISRLALKRRRQKIVAKQKQSTLILQITGVEESSSTPPVALYPGPSSSIKPPKKKQKVIDVEEPKTNVVLRFPARISTVSDPNFLLDESLDLETFSCRVVLKFRLGALMRRAMLMIVELRV
ncbi:hypothetical protein ACOSQ2_010033 [Xanthoceras sorbifolium]